MAEVFLLADDPSGLRVYWADVTEDRASEVRKTTTTSALAMIGLPTLAIVFKGVANTTLVFDTTSSAITRRNSCTTGGCTATAVIRCCSQAAFLVHLVFIYWTGRRSVYRSLYAGADFLSGYRQESNGMQGRYCLQTMHVQNNLRWCCWCCCWVVCQPIR